MPAEVFREWDTKDGFRGVSVRLETGQVMSVARHSPECVSLSWDIDGDIFGPADFLNRVAPRYKDTVTVSHSGGIYRPRFMRGLLLTHQVANMEDVTVVRVDEKDVRTLTWEWYRSEGYPDPARLTAVNMDWDTTRHYARRLGALEVAVAVPDVLSFISE